MISWHDCPTVKSHTPLIGHSGKKHPACRFIIYLQSGLFHPPAPALKRSPRNKLTGLGGGSLRKDEAVEIGTLLTMHENRVLEPELCFCVNRQSLPVTTKVHVCSMFLWKGLRYVWNGERWCKHDIKARSVMSSWEKIKQNVWPWVPHNSMIKNKTKKTLSGPISQ